MNIAIEKFFTGNTSTRIFNYPEYLEYSEDKLNETNENELDELGKKYLSYRKINLQRTNRIQKSYKPREEILELIKKINKPQYWIIITEDWCGDSAQNLPYIMKYVEQNIVLSSVQSSVAF